MTAGHASRRRPELFGGPRPRRSIMAFRAAASTSCVRGMGSADPRARQLPAGPLSGRVDRAPLRFGGRDRAADPQFPPEPHAIHGDGWTSPGGGAGTPTSAALALRPRQPGRSATGRTSCSACAPTGSRSSSRSPIGAGGHAVRARPAPLFHTATRPCSRPRSPASGCRTTNIPRQLEPVPVPLELSPAPPGRRARARPQLPGLVGHGPDRLAGSRAALLIEADPPSAISSSTCRPARTSSASSRSARRRRLQPVAPGRRHRRAGARTGGPCAAPSATGRCACRRPERRAYRTTGQRPRSPAFRFSPDRPERPHTQPPSTM